MDAADLERRAVEEILREAKNAAERAREMGTAGWLKPAVPPTNKRFLHNTLVSTMRPLYREPRMRHRGRRSRSRSRSRSPHKPRHRSSERDRKASGKRKRHSKSANGVDRHRGSTDHKYKSDNMKKIKDNSHPDITASTNKESSHPNDSSRAEGEDCNKEEPTKESESMAVDTGKQSAEPCKLEDSAVQQDTVTAESAVNQNTESTNQTKLDSATDSIQRVADINGEPVASQPETKEAEKVADTVAAIPTPSETAVPQTEKPKHKKHKKKKKKKGHKRKSHKKHKSR